MTLRAVRFALPDGSIRIGRLDGDSIQDAGPAGGRGFIPDRDGFAQIEHASGSVYDADAVTFLAPVAPTKVIAIGLNYRDHAEESELEIPPVPVVFAKWPSCLTGHRAPIVLPPEETRPDYEGELAVVFSKRCRRVAASDAGTVIGGYCAFDDVSGRRAQLETPLRQFTFGKSFDSFGPMGPCLLPTDGVALDQLDVRTTVSGQVMQDSNTRNLIFGVAELVAYVSIATTIEAGDVLITGTPGGVGDSRRPPRYLRAGDVVEVDITGCPTLRNPVLAEAERAG